MCEGKFLVKTLISQNNIIQEVQIENYRCGLRIIKKAPGDWACQDLNKLKKQAKRRRKAGGGGESCVLTGAESPLVVEQESGKRPEAPSEKNSHTVGKISPEKSETGKSGNTLRQLLSSREELRKYFQEGDQGKKEGKREGIPEEGYNHGHSTLLSLLRNDLATSSLPPPPLRRRDLPESGDWVKSESIGNGNQFVVHRNSAITITKLPPPPRIGESSGVKQSFKVQQNKFRKTGLVSKTKKKSHRSVQNKYLSHLLGPSPLLKLQLLNLFVVPLNGENSFPDLLPLKNVSKLKMLFDEDGGKGSSKTTDSSAKKEVADPKRGREEDEDEGVEDEGLKKVKVEAEDDDNLIIDENVGLSDAVADNPEDNDSHGSFSNQNGIDAEGNGKSNDSSKTGENSGDSRDSPVEMETEDGESKLKAAVQGLSASKLNENFKEQEKISDEGEGVKNGHDILASKALTTKGAAAINHSPSKPRNSFLDSCNSNAANSVASSSNCSENGDNTKVIQLEKEIMGLTSLLKSKEREWNALLELKKLKELAVEYYRRQKDVEELFDDDVIQEHEEYLKKLTDRINYLSDKGGPDEAQVRTNIQKTEKEIKEGETKLKIVSVQGKFTGSKDSSNDSGTGDSANMENFKASLALQQLCERNKTTMAQATSPVQVSSNAAGLSNKVIGEGRQGAIVEVRSIIADYRSKNPEENSRGSTSETQRRRPQAQRKQSSATQQNSSAASNFLSQNRNVSFKDVLVNLAKLSQTEKIVGTNPVIESTPTPSPRPSTKNNVSSRQANSHGADRGQLSTTLAKLLSSNNSVTNMSSSMLQDDSSPMSTLKIDSLNHGGDNSLSLANLLASAKCRDDEVKGDDEELVPICQGCNTNRAQFVCAGCGNQWYCCRECQIQAWEDHSEVCSG